MEANDPRLKKLQKTKKGDKDVSEWMKSDWDSRASVDAMYFVKSDFGLTENKFWKTGYRNMDKNILKKDTKWYPIILQNKHPKQMRVLEIGCGLGRILIPMSKIFGEIIGIDVSKKMIAQAKKFTENISNCNVFENNGSDLGIFPKNYFDFCYSFIVFQHVPQKEIVVNYIKEVSRVLKSGGIFRFQVHGGKKSIPDKIDTWNGVRFSSEEIHKITKQYKFKILDEKGIGKQYYWITCKSIK